jgi:hypothetical protein
MSVTAASYRWNVSRRSVDSLLTLPFLTLQSEAKIQVNRVRPKWVKWEREYEDDEVSAVSVNAVIIQNKCWPRPSNTSQLRRSRYANVGTAVPGETRQ